MIVGFSFFLALTWKIKLALFLLLNPLSIISWNKINNLPREANVLLEKIRYLIKMADVALLGILNVNMQCDFSGFGSETFFFEAKLLYMRQTVVHLCSQSPISQAFRFAGKEG